MKLENMVDQTLNLILNAPGYIANAMKASIGLISAGTGSIYRAIAGLFQPRPAISPAIPRTLIDISQAFARNKVPDHKALLNDKGSLYDLLQVPDVFKGRAIGSQRVDKLSISREASSLLARLNETYALRQRSIIAFNKVNLLMQEHDLLDEEKFFHGKLGVMLRGEIDRIGQLWNKLEANIDQVVDKNSPFYAVRRENEQHRMLRKFERFISSLEHKNWIPARK